MEEQLKMAKNILQKHVNLEKNGYWAGGTSLPSLKKFGSDVRLKKIPSVYAKKSQEKLKHEIKGIMKELPEKKAPVILEVEPKMWRVPTALATLPEKPLEKKESKPLSPHNLMDGIYDEKESAVSFQDALREWRESGQKKTLENTIEDKLTVEDKHCQSTEKIQGLNIEQVMDSLEEHRNLSLLQRMLLKKLKRDIQ